MSINVNGNYTRLQRACLEQNAGWQVAQERCGGNDGEAQTRANLRTLRKWLEQHRVGSTLFEREHRQRFIWMMKHMGVFSDSVAYYLCHCVVSEINVTSHRGRKWEVQVKALLALKYLNSLGWSISY